MRKGYRVKACVVSNIGRARSSHEDNFLMDDGRYLRAAEQKAMSEEICGWKHSRLHCCAEAVKCNGTFAVSDGIGGHRAGEVASRIAVEQLYSMREYIFRTSDAAGIRERFQDYVAEANNLITAGGRMEPEFRGMGATLTGILLCEEGVLPFNLGDSRTYAYKAGELERVTRDHTVGQRLLDYGVVTAEELYFIENAKAITRYLGVDDEYMVPQAEIGRPLHIDSRAWFLICSDGVTDMLSDIDIEEILSQEFTKGSLQQAAVKMVEKALEDNPCRPGGRDNITVILVEIEKYMPAILKKVREQLDRLSGRAVPR